MINLRYVALGPGGAQVPTYGAQIVQALSFSPVNALLSTFAAFKSRSESAKLRHCESPSAADLAYFAASSSAGLISSMVATPSEILTRDLPSIVHAFIASSFGEFPPKEQPATKSTTTTDPNARAHCSLLIITE
jgi:hypothetical protein